MAPDRTGRVEQGRSLVTVDQIRDWCGNPDAEVVVKPVLDLDGCVSVDSYEVPDRICEQVALRDAHLRVPVVHAPGTALRLRPHRGPPRRRRDLLMQPGRPVSSPPSAQDSLALELRRARPRSLPLDQPPRLPVPPRPPRHHRPLARPATSGPLARPLTGPPMAGGRGMASVGVLGDVHDRAVRIAHEEASETPLLVGDRVGDLGAGFDRACVDFVDVVDLDGHVRVLVCLDVQRRDAELDLALLGAEDVLQSSPGPPSRPMTPV